MLANIPLIHGRTMVFHRAAPPPSPAVSRQPNLRPRSLFIVGAPRTGTTSLSKALARHPDVCFAKPKETHFFLKQGAAGDPKGLRERFERAYFRNLRPEHRLIAEGSVSYLYDPSAIQRILEFDPEALIVVGLRNPLELLPSYHARLLYTMDEDVAEFERAWALQGARRQGKSLPPRCREPRLLQYGAVGRLGGHLRRLLEVAGADRCMLIVFDDFQADPLRIYRKLLDFAGLPDDGRTELRAKNENRAYEWRWLQPLVMNPPAPIARLAGIFSDSGHTRLRGLVRPLRRRLKKANTRRLVRPPLPLHLRRELSDYFREDVAELGHILHRDLSAWLEPRG